MLREMMQEFRPRIANYYRQLKTPSPPNLVGDRDVEYSWVAANMPHGPGKALDFGCGSYWMGLLAARRGFSVTAIDLTRIRWNYVHDNLEFLQMDVLDCTLGDASYDLVVNCSSIEHVGLRGRYSVRSQGDDDDLAAMEALRGLLKPSGIMLMTVPVGRDAIFMPYHRVYGRKRLPRLLGGWTVKNSEFWAKDPDNVWVRVEEADVLEQDASDHYYGLGLFVLGKCSDQIELHEHSPAD